MRKLNYAKEQILVVRPCLRAICNGNGPAGKLLSVLLHLYEYNDKLKKGSIQTKDGETIFTLCCTQAELLTDLCGEMDITTLHEVAIPALLLLGYLDVKDQMKANRYTVYIDRVDEALIAYTQGLIPLRNIIRSHLQLGKFLIELTEEELGKFLIPDKRFFNAQLRKVLIAIRKNPNCKRGPKSKAERSSEAGLWENGQIGDSIFGNREFPNWKSDAEDSPEADIASFSDSADLIRDSEIRNRDSYKGAANADTPTQRGKKGSKKATIQRPLIYSLPAGEETSKSNRRIRTTKKVASNQPLELPDLSQPPTEELIMQLADYHRGYPLPRDGHNRDYKKARDQGAIPLLTKRRPATNTVGYTLQEIDLVWRLCRKDGKGGEEIGKPWLRDEDYIKGPYTLDLWNLPKLMDSKLALIAELEAAHNRKSTAASPKPDVASSEQQGDELVFWSETPGAWKDPLENYESFYYMPVAKAMQYDYKPYRKLTPLDENNVKARQRKRAVNA